MRGARVFLTSLALLCAGCPSEGGKGMAGGPRGGSRKVAAAVATAPVEARAVEERLVGHAALEAEAVVDVICRVEGVVASLSAEEGDEVGAGEVLAKLDPTRVELALRDAQLALEQAENTLARRALMHKQGVGSAEELETARTARKQAELVLEQAKLDRAEVNLRTPREGVVVERAVAVGTHLSPNTITFRVADRDPLLAKVRIPEAQAERVRVGQAARVRVEGRAEPLAGEVIRVAPRVDLESGTVIATVAVRKGTASIRLNRFATVELVVAARERALTIPLDALAVRGREDQVLVAVDLKPGERGQQGKAELRRVRVGVRQGERVEVLEGLSAGEQVIVAAPDDLRSGAPVRVLPAEGVEPAPVGSASRR